MVRKIGYLLLSVLMLYSVGACKQNSGSGGGLDVPTDISNFGLEIDQSEMTDFVDNMSSPVEMAALIKHLEVDFSNKYLAATDNIEDFTTSYQQAFNLGIFSADLGYLNMYNKTNTVIDYIGAIKTLADGVNVGQFFDFSTLKRLAQNNQNLDSLMLISVQSFNQMDRYLRNNNRTNLSVLIVTGVWMEGMYLATQVYKEKPHPQLKERIGEQKIIMDKLMLFLKNFEQDKYFQSLVAELELLHEDLKQVKITVELGETEAIEKDGMLVFVQNDVSIVDVSDELIVSITEKTEQIRNKLISL